MATPPTSFDDRNASSLLTGIEQPPTSHGPQHSDLETQSSPSGSAHGPSGREGSQEPFFNGSDTDTDREPPAGRRSSKKAAAAVTQEPKDLVWTEQNDNEHKQLCETLEIPNCLKAREMEVATMEAILALPNPGVGMEIIKSVMKANERSNAAASRWKVDTDQMIHRESKTTAADSFSQAGLEVGRIFVAIVDKAISAHEELVQEVDEVTAQIGKIGKPLVYGLGTSS
jgi:hypothetical protein